MLGVWEMTDIRDAGSRMPVSLTRRSRNTGSDETATPRRRGGGGNAVTELPLRGGVVSSKLKLLRIGVKLSEDDRACAVDGRTGILLGIGIRRVGIREDEDGRSTWSLP